MWTAVTTSQYAPSGQLCSERSCNAAPAQRAAADISTDLQLQSLGMVAVLLCSAALVHKVVRQRHDAQPAHSTSWPGSTGASMPRGVCAEAGTQKPDFATSIMGVQLSCLQAVDLRWHAEAEGACQREWPSSLRRALASLYTSSDVGPPQCAPAGGLRGARLLARFLRQS